MEQGGRRGCHHKLKREGERMREGMKEEEEEEEKVELKVEGASENCWSRRG